MSVCIDLRLNARIFDQIPVVGQKVNAVVTPEQQYERLGVRKTSLLPRSSVPLTRSTIKLEQFYQYMEIIKCDTGYAAQTNPIGMK